MDFTFTTSKPQTEKELEDFKIFKRSVKSHLSVGKLRVTERFKTFSFQILNCKGVEKEGIMLFLNEGMHPVQVMLVPEMQEV